MSNASKPRHQINLTYINEVDVVERLDALAEEAGETRTDMTKRLIRERLDLEASGWKIGDPSLTSIIAALASLTPRQRMEVAAILAEKFPGKFSVTPLVTFRGKGRKSGT